jgi:uncharacterized protein YceK
MNNIVSLSLAIIAISLAGCGSPIENVRREQNRQAEASGSPFRWKIQSVGGGTTMSRVMIDLPLGATKAGVTLKKDILSQIEKVELSKQRKAPEIAEVRLLPDGREVWIINNQQDGIAYIVTMKPSPQGGTDFAIDGPNLFDKNGG